MGIFIWRFGIRKRDIDYLSIGESSTISKYSNLYMASHYYLDPIINQTSVMPLISSPIIIGDKVLNLIYER